MRREKPVAQNVRLPVPSNWSAILFPAYLLGSSALLLRLLEREDGSRLRRSGRELVPEGCCYVRFEDSPSRRVVELGFNHVTRRSFA